MRLRLLSCLLLLAVCFDATAADLYTEINRLRAGEGNCAAARHLPPLKRRQILRMRFSMCGGPQGGARPSAALRQISTDARAGQFRCDRHAGNEIDAPAVK